MSNTNRKKHRSPESEAIFEKVRKALENDKYKFRTLKGISKDTNIPEQKIEVIIRKNPDEIVIVLRRNQDGERLYTTRRHYKKKSTAVEKLIGALINRVY